MTGDKTLFSTLFFKERGFVSYVNNNKENILDFGTIGKPPNPRIRKVLLVKGLKHMNIVLHKNKHKTQNQINTSNLVVQGLSLHNWRMSP